MASGKSIAGHDLPFADYDKRIVSEDELYSTISHAFSSNVRRAASYKFGFMKALLDNLYNVDATLTVDFYTLFSKFAEIYWNLILKYELKQMPDSKRFPNGTYLEQIIFGAKTEFGIVEGVTFEALPEQIKATICRRVTAKCKANVVGALYGDTLGLCYSFNRSQEWLQFNPQMYEFLCKHKLMIEKINYFEWARYLEKINSEDKLSMLLGKLDASTKRSNLDYYRQLLFNEFEAHNCFYCGKQLSAKKNHVDHFIPWSFIKDDKLWNFVLACEHCNERKNDKLADRFYLKRLVERNRQLVITQDTRMINYNEDNLVNIYNWAQLNGFESNWKPSGVETAYEIPELGLKVAET